MERELTPDGHHPYFERKAHEKCLAGKAIVNAFSFPIKMDYGIHHFELHPNCDKLPVLETKSMEIVRANFVAVENPIETINNLMLAFLRAENCGKLDYSQQKLAYISIECLKKQLPYIKFGMIKGVK